MKFTNSGTEEVLTVIKDEAKAVAASYGVQWTDEAAASLIRRIVTRLGGIQVYIPRQTAADKKSRDALIFDRFNGFNFKQLAKDFKTSERTIRRIIQAGRLKRQAGD